MVAAVDNQELQPDVVIVAPPNRDLAVHGGRLSVRDPEARRGPSPGIDHLFESIARDWGPRGVGVVLGDRAHGLRAIKAAEGLTIAQQPDSAKFDSTPRSAIALGAADLILAPAAMAERLVALSREDGGWFGDSLSGERSAALGAVTTALRRSTGIDFSGYKETTLRRQINRRIAVRQLSGVNGYLATLKSDPAEPTALMANLLVTVTSFFRDPDAFEALEERVRSYLLDRTSAEPLRVWVPGCATGEEVYSLGMLFARALGHPADLTERLTIFATDLDESSLSVARRAVYPLSCLDQIPADLRAGFVVSGATQLEIASELRECTVFARHNLVEDRRFPGSIWCPAGTP